MQNKALLITVAAALVTAGVAVAGEIYKWTDAEGNVHYEDRPSGNVPVQRVAIASKNTDNAAVQARVTAQREARATDDQVEAEAPPQMSRQEIRAEQAKRKERCDQYRARLETMLASQRLYREDDAGERVYLDESEIQAAQTRVREQIKEYCG